jgi:hypothetical protein
MYRTFESFGHAPPHILRIHWHRPTRAAMPRTLSRLRYRKPLPPITFNRLDGRPRLDLEQRIAEYVVRQSNPQHLKLQVVVNPKARLPATGQRGIAPKKPYTLKDVIDPEGKAQHGEIIYIFRNIKTNQIIYSLQELLNVRSTQYYRKKCMLIL